MVWTAAGGGIQKAVIHALQFQQSLLEPLLLLQSTFEPVTLCLAFAVRVNFPSLLASSALYSC